MPLRPRCEGACSLLCLRPWDWIVSVLGSVLQVSRPGGASHGCTVDRLPLRCRAAGLLAPARAGGWAGLPSSSDGPAPGTPRQTVFFRDIAWYRVRTVNKAPCPLSPTQALKYECYLDSPLVRFLLKRAVSDLRVTHYFFW